MTALIVVSPVVLDACGSERSANTSNDLYACSSAADCLVGRACICRYCQDPAAPRLTCEAGDAPDAVASPDTAAPDAPASDIQASDTGSGPCNLSTWQPCEPGQGCYYAPATQAKSCQIHGNLGEGSTCDPALPQACGTSAADGRPLICDAIDKKCYRTCVCDKPGDLACPGAMVCYCLKDGTKPWPDGAGICAP